jgi:small GTP-binding protein
MLREPPELPACVTTVHSLTGHEHPILALAWSPDGTHLISASHDKICIWAAESGKLLRCLIPDAPATRVLDVIIPTNSRFITVSRGGSPEHRWIVDIWSLLTGEAVERWTHDCDTLNISALPDGRSFALAGKLRDGESVLDVIHLERDLLRFSIKDDYRIRTGAILSPDDHHVYYVATPERSDEYHEAESVVVRGYDINLKNRTSTRPERSHILSLILSPDRKRLFASTDTARIFVIDTETGEIQRTLEAGVEPIPALALSADGKMLCARAADDQVRLWRCADWTLLGTFRQGAPGASGDADYLFPKQVAFHPSQPLLAVTMHEGSQSHTRIGVFRCNETGQAAEAHKAVFYATARIALVGDPGVGKTGLGRRLAGQPFAPTPPTHGQQFWVIKELGKTLRDGTLCEAVLWDFAGQPEYRPIHSLFLDDIDLALIVFDAARDTGFDTVDYWWKQLGKGKSKCKILLVAARVDWNRPLAALEEYEAYCLEKHINGYVATSAVTGEGVDQLIELIRQNINWSRKEATVTTELFKGIKDGVLRLKSDGSIAPLLEWNTLRSRLTASAEIQKFTNADMETAVGHLEAHGYVRVLPGAEKSVLLSPDLLINLTARLLLAARADRRNAGVLDESAIQRNDIRLAELDNLDGRGRSLLLNAAIEMLIRRNLCFRQESKGKNYLIFPSLITERHIDEDDERELEDDSTFVLKGKTENAYPTLVVLIGYTSDFQRAELWQGQAEYRTKNGHVCGFRLIPSRRKHEHEFALYFSKSTPTEIRNQFKGLFETIARSLPEIKLLHYPSVTCPSCQSRQDRDTLMKRVRVQRVHLICEECGHKIGMSSIYDEAELSLKELQEVERKREFARLRGVYEEMLVNLIGQRGDKKVSCFISYAWETAARTNWIEQLARDLRSAGVHVEFDQWQNAAPGQSIIKFMTRIENCDFVLVMGTPLYRQKYENKTNPAGSMVAAEGALIDRRLTETEGRKETVLPLLLEGEEKESLPPLLHGRVYLDFRQPAFYFVNLYKLLLTLYRLPFDDDQTRDRLGKLARAAQQYEQDLRRVIIE